MHKKDAIVYFAGAIRGDRVAAAEMREIVLYIRLLGLNVLTEHIIEPDPFEAHAKAMGVEKANITAEDIERQDMAWLDQATHVVAEISGSSTGTGRIIEYGRLKGQFGKVPAKVLCLYREDRRKIASPLVRGMTQDRYPNVEVYAYKDSAEMKKIIKDFLQAY